MPDPVVPSTARCILTVQQSNGDVGVNVMHFHTATDHLTLTQLQALADHVVTVWTTDIKGIVSNKDKLVHVRTQDLSTVPYVTFDETVSVVGLDSTIELPKQIAACLSLSSTHPGRSGRGRIYQGSLCESSIAAGGVLTATCISQMQTYGNDLKTNFVSGSATFNLAVYSRKNGLAYDVTSVLCDARADVQRRRANRRLF